MAKVTVVKEKNYTTIDNGIFKDTRISFKAKGLLTTMLSLPPTWNYTIEGLATLSKDGRDSIKTALKELENFGYLERKQVRNDNGSFCDLEYFVYEKPQPKEPLAENPPADKSLAENHRQLSTDISSTDKSNTDGVNTKGLNTDDNSFSTKKDIQSNSPKGEQSNSFSSEKKTAASNQTKRHSEKEIEDMVSQIPLRARRIAYEMTGDTEKATRVYECIDYFLGKHKEHLKERHKVLKDETLRKIVFKFIEGIEIERDGYTDVYDGLASTSEFVGDYRDVIDEYFNTDFKEKCDYSLVHFSSDTVLTNMMNHVCKEEWCESM